MPTLDKLARDYRNKGLVILGIGAEEPEVFEKFYKTQTLSYPTAIDATNNVRAHYTTKVGVPYTVILDRKGRVVADAYDTRPEAEFLRLLGKAGLKQK